MSLFDKFAKKPQTKSELPKADLTHSSSPSPTEALKQSDSTSEGYYFQNVIELAIYGKFHGKDKTVSWLQGDKYISEYNKGYQLFEQGKFQDALVAYRKCLKFNPIGISARFEICETYIQMQKLRDAKSTLLEMKEYLIEEKNIARFYRRLGYIAIEERNYECALASFLYSLTFENHPSVQSEVVYIQSISQISPKRASSIANNVSSILLENEIPVLTETKLY